MSVEKVNKRKIEKKNRKANEKRLRRKQTMVSVISLGLIAVMLISPVLIYIADFTNQGVQSELTDGTNSQIVDSDGNVIGYVDADGNIQYLDTATDSNAVEFDETEAIYDDDGNEVGHRHSDGSEHYDSEE